MSVVLYQFPGCWGLPNASPFCVKVEAYMRVAAIDYRTESMPDPRKAPKGKLPFIEHNNKKIADSNLVIRYLQSEFANDLDSNLSVEQLAVHHAMRRMLDEHLYFVILYNRWADDDNWPTLRKDFFQQIPVAIRRLVTGQIRKGVLKDLYSQGMGRHSKAEIYAMGAADLDSLANYLGEHNYFGGESICILDICVSAYLMNLLNTPIDGLLKSAVQSHQNLVAFNERMLKQVFPEVAL